MVTIGAVSFDDKYYEEMKRKNKCPCQCYSGGSVPMCMAWGSGTPFRYFTRECTFEEMLECPIKRQYPDEKLIDEWDKWLKEKGLT